MGYTSNLFDNSFSINGSFAGNLYVTLNKKYFDISMALYELMPDGKYFFLTRFIGRAPYAKDSSKRQLLKAGQKESIPFENKRLISRKINKGSRLVILLNVNKQPYEIVNNGSGKDPNDETTSDADVPLQLMWHNKSFINIPIW